MPYRFNPFSRKFDYYEVSTPGASAGTGIGWAGEVADHAALPTASEHSGESYLVQAASGVWPFRKKAGLWRAAGGIWAYLGAATLTALADVPAIPDSVGSYALVSVAGSYEWINLTSIAGNMSAVQIVQVLQSAFGRLTWLLSGNSEGGEPDTATAAALAAFIAQTGVNPDYVNWLDIGASAGSGSLVIDDAYSASFADALMLALAGGSLTISDAYSASFADNVILTNADLLVLVIADAYSASSADTVTLAFAGSDLVIADAYSASFADAL
jgi:hypothetical protein